MNNNPRTNAPWRVLIIGSGFAGVGLAMQLRKAGEEDFLLLEKAAEVVPVEHLWVNPDCGLKTRGWAESEAALANMVAAARQLRRELAG